MKLLVLPRYDRSGASSRQRLLQYVPDLARLGWEITIRPLQHVRGGNGPIRLNAVPAKAGTIIAGSDEGSN